MARTLRIMSANLLNGGADAAAIAEAGRVAGGAIQSADRPAPVSAADSDYAARGGATASLASSREEERCDACGAVGSPKQAGASSDVTETGSASSPSPRVLIGDFNATPIWPLYRRTASQFTDAAVAVARARGSKLSPTWSPRPGMPKLFRIDHGFVRGLDVEEFKVFEVPGSDHSAIVMDLVLP